MPHRRCTWTISWVGLNRSLIHTPANQPPSHPIERWSSNHHYAAVVRSTATVRRKPEPPAFTIFGVCVYVWLIYAQSRAVSFLMCTSGCDQKPNTICIGCVSDGHCRIICKVICEVVDDQNRTVAWIEFGCDGLKSGTFLGEQSLLWLCCIVTNTNTVTNKTNMTEKTDHP